jgi:hypothetical protein
MQYPELSSCSNAPENRYCTTKSRLELQRNIGAVTTIVAGVTAVTFVTLGILARRSEIERSGRHNAIACYPGPFSLTCATTF